MTDKVRKNPIQRFRPCREVFIPFELTPKNLSTFRIYVILVSFIRLSLILLANNR